MSGISTRNSILRAGAELIYKKGYTATGLNEILEASGVPKGSFYHHYGSKEAFALEVVDFHLGFLVSWLGDSLSPEGPSGSLGPLERLRRFFGDYRQFLERREFRDGCPIGNLAQEMGALPETFGGKLREAFGLMRAPIEACILEARRVGVLPVGMEPAETADFILNSWEGALLRMKASGDDSPLRTFERIVFDRLLSI